MFEEVINRIHWDEICMLHYGDANASLKSFYDTHIYHLDEISPFHEVTLKEFRLMTKPWITKEILAKCDTRDALLKQIKSETDPLKLQFLNTEYKRLRNQITSEKRNSKKKFQITQFEKNKNKSSDVWKSIRALVNIKPSKSTNIKLMDGENNLISDPRIIGNMFNDHFSTLGTNVQAKIPHADGSYTNYLTKRGKNENGEPGKGKLLINPNGCSFFLSATGPDEIKIIIECSETSKSTGSISIPMSLLKGSEKFS